VSPTNPLAPRTPQLPSALQDTAPDASALQPSAESPEQPRPTAPRPHRSGAAQPARSRFNYADHPASISLLLTLALPTLVEQFLSAGIGFTDTLVAGHTGLTPEDHAASAAAVGAMTYLQWFAGLMTAAFNAGAMAVIARSIGAKRPRLANRVAGTVCSGAVLVGIAIALLFFSAAPFLVAFLFRLHGLAATLGIQYLRIMSFTICLQTLGQVGMACLRGAGDTLRPMLVTTAIFLVNAVASPALSFGWFGLPALGIEGNAIGTLLAFAAAGITTAYFLLKSTSGIHLRLRHLRIRPHLLQRVFKIGIPSWAEGCILWGGQMFIVNLVTAPTDEAFGASGTTIAAHAATLRIESLAFLPGFGFGIACAALVGQYLGAKKPAEALHATRLANRITILTMSLTALPMVFFPKLMLGLLVDSPLVIHAGYIPLLLAGLAQPGFAISIIMSSCLKGAGDTVSPMLCSLTGITLRAIAVFPLMYLFARMGHPSWGLIAVWLAINLDLNYRAVYCTWAVHRGKWQHLEV
jgi:putative MATE family efflux protein